MIGPLKTALWSIGILGFLTVSAWITPHLSASMQAFVRYFTSYAILGLVIWGFLRFGHEAKMARHDTRALFDRMLWLLDQRSKEIMDLKISTDQVVATSAQVAKALAQVTASELAEIVSDNSKRLDEVHAAVKEGTSHAEHAYKEANSVNKKIEDLNNRLVEQGEAVKAKDEETSKKLDDMEKIGTGVLDLVKPIPPSEVSVAEQLDEIQKTGEETNTIVKDKLP